MKLKWTVVDPHSGIKEDAPANAAGFGNIHGILAICFMSGSIAGPWIGSLIWSFGGYNLLIILFFILAICGNISALVLKNYKPTV